MHFNNRKNEKQTNKWKNVGVRIRLHVISMETLMICVGGVL